MRVRLGMVGGGPGAFIGAVHRMAAALDGDWELVAGAFSSDPVKSGQMGRELGLDPRRVYGSFTEMAEAEAGLPADERIEAVSIVTPNHLHTSVARVFLEHGFHVICDKPLTTRLADAEELVRLAEQRDLVLAVTYNYTGYPMVKEARTWVREGRLGPVRKVIVEYSQGWLATLLEARGHKQAEWRGDPDRAGPSSALGDIGSHAYDLLRYVTGLDATELFADLGTVVEGRRMEDDATVLLRLGGGVRGLLIASQIAAGERNHLRLRVYGAEGGLDWSQEDPNRLRLAVGDGTETVLHRGTPLLSPRATAHTRLPSGHPEGFIEAFANVYRNVAQTLRDGGAFASDFPTGRDGAAGVHFIERALASAKQGAWVDATYAEAPASGDSANREDGS